MSHRIPPGLFAWPQRLGLAALALGAAATPALASDFWYVTPVTRYGHQVDWLYQVMMWASIAILIIVEVALAAALIKFRKRKGDEQRQPESWSHNTALEVTWTVIPFVLLILILWPTFKTLSALADVPLHPDYTLEIVGHQFYWEYRYPDLGVTFSSTPRDAQGGYGEPLEIPIEKNLRVNMTSADVIHAWWIPAFSVQQMTTPGNMAQIPLYIEKAGDYTGACAFLCGPQHGAMGIFVRAVDENTFKAWANAHKATNPIKPFSTAGNIGATPPPPEENNKKAEEEAAAALRPAAAAAPPTDAEAKDLAAKGNELYTSKCAGCHQPTGAGIPGVFPPLAGSEIVLGPDKDLVGIVDHGRTGPIHVKGADYNGAMPPVGAAMSDAEVAEVITYVRTAWGNKGKPVGAGQVKGLK